MRHKGLRAFLPQKGRGRKLFAPCVPSARFPVWVTVWVRATVSTGVGQLLMAWESLYFALLRAIKRHSEKSIEPPAENCVPVGWLYSFTASFPYGSKCGASRKCGTDILRNTGFLLLLFCPSDTGHFLREIALFLGQPYNSECQIAGKYQTTIPYTPCCLRRAVRNTRQPVQPDHQFSCVRVSYSSILIFQTLKKQQ